MFENSNTTHPGFLLRLLAIALLLAPAALAQNPTGTLTGTVTDVTDAALPGVTVTAVSPNLQGARVTQTGATGGFKLAFLPPGSYKLSYELEGFSTAVQEVKVSAAQASIADIQLQLGELMEEIVVTSNIETISETTTAAVTYSADEIGDLPVDRDIEGAVGLAPGVHATGPSDNISISGAMSFENLWLINGVVVNENIRGQSLNLFIEDAIQETTTTTSGISAEYGRFTGGVVNVLTKSGGNDLSGSARLSFDNEDWESENAGDLSVENVDEDNDTLEVTLGGPFWKDRIWFFTAYRDFELSENEPLFFGGSVVEVNAEERFEGKLTVSLTPSHNLTGSYIEIDQTQQNSGFQDVYIDEEQFSDRMDPQELRSINYTGILGTNFFVESQYSERELSNGIGSGGPRPTGNTPADFGASVPYYGSGVAPGWYNSAIFCADCETESRNNENFLVKGSYFLATEGLGTHDLVVGYDDFTQRRFAVNHQSGSDFIFIDHDTLVDGNQDVYPVFFSPDELGPIASALDFLWWVPPFNADTAQPDDLGMKSLYVNDSWALNEKWSFNVGVRYDENDARNTAGALITDDSKLSPRLGATYDVKGNGDLVLNASYGTYVANVFETDDVGATSSAGQLAFFSSWYGGPSINTNAACQNNPGPDTCLTPAQATEVILTWYFAPFGGTAPAATDASIPLIPNRVSTCVPGATAVIPETVRSPAADELTVGLTKRLGTKGLFRADVVLREWEDFYSNRIDAETIASTDPQGQISGIGDVTFVGNYGDDVLEREYQGLHTQFRYRLTEQFTLAGNYTWSKVEGNIVGETQGAGPVEDSPGEYPEYADVAWTDPVGRLGSDQTHKVRLWGIYTLLDNEHQRLSASLLTSYLSGTPYGASSDVPVGAYVTNDPGYLSPPAQSTYWFTARDAFETDDVTRTDLSLNYSFGWSLFGRDMEVFLQPELLNVFNEDAVTNPDNTAFAYDDSAGDSVSTPFDPFTQTPVEGVNWRKGDNFGQPLDENDYQLPRTFRFSVGFRF